jgi:hypothetical protein
LGKIPKFLSSKKLGKKKLVKNEGGKKLLPEVWTFNF